MAKSVTSTERGATDTGLDGFRAVPLQPRAQRRDTPFGTGTHLSWAVSPEHGFVVTPDKLQNRDASENEIQ